MFDESDFEIVRPPFLVPMPDWRELANRSHLPVRTSYENNALSEAEKDSIAFCLLRAIQRRPALVVSNSFCVYVMNDWCIRHATSFIVSAESYRFGFLRGFKRSATPATRKA